MRQLSTPIETDRLLIRAAEAGAASLVNQAICESIEELRRWMPWAEQRIDIAGTERHMREAETRYQDGSDCSLTIWLRRSGEFVGACGLHARPADPRWREI